MKSDPKIFRPMAEEFELEGRFSQGAETPGPANSSLPVFSMDQIASQLTNGYWGGSSYAFAVGPGDTLTVDLTGLTQAGQDMARQALQAWSNVTGINFTETPSSQGGPSAVVAEGPDAASGIFTAYSMDVGEDFEGSLSGAADRDGIAVTLAAGERITVSLEGDNRNGNALIDPYLRLRDDTGALLLENDDANGSDSLPAFQAPIAGTYYLQAGAHEDAYLGDYRLEVRAGLTSADITSMTKTLAPMPSSLPRAAIFRAPSSTSIRIGRVDQAGPTATITRHTCTRLVMRLALVTPEITTARRHTA